MGAEGSKTREPGAREAAQDEGSEFPTMTPAMSKAMRDEVETICSVYHRAASDHNAKAFQEAYQDCVARRTGRESEEEFIRRRNVSLESLGFPRTHIESELHRQALAYACADARSALTACQEDPKGACSGLEAAFNTCMASMTNEEAVADYERCVREGVQQKYLKNQRGMEMAKVARLHFA